MQESLVKWRKQKNNLESQVSRLLEARKKNNKNKNRHSFLQQIPGIFAKISDFPQIFVVPETIEDESDEEYGNMGCQVSKRGVKNINLFYVNRHT